MRRVERVARAGHVADDELQGDARHKLEGRHRIPLRFAQHAEQPQRGGRGVERDERRRYGGGARKQPERRGCHDAERALGADEELLQVVAGVVLAQRGQLVEHPAVR